MKTTDYNRKQHSALIYVLRGLIPYTQENILLSFKPKRFFNELAQFSGYSEQTIRTTYYRARCNDLVAPGLVPTLTEKGRRKIRPYQASQLGHNARLIVLFDIPQKRVATRNAFRRLLQSLDFTMVQQSVWMTDKDHRLLLYEAIKDFDLKGCVEVHESVRLSPK